MKLVHCKRIWEMMYSNLIIVFLLLTLITASLFLTGNIVKKQQESHQVSSDFADSYGKNTYYWMNESFDDLTYYSYMKGDANGQLYDAMRTLLDSLWNENNFQFYTCNNQNLSIEGKVDDIFLYGYEYGDTEGAVNEIDGKTWSTLNSLLVSDKFFDCNNVNIEEGRKFNSNDYYFNDGNNIPVILGSDFKEKYKIGDRFKANYLSTELTIEVVGFIDNQTFYLSSASNDFVSLERYVLLPAWKIEEPSDFSRCLSIVELSGNVQSKLGDSKTAEAIDLLYKQQNSAWTFSLRNPEQEGQVSVVKKYTSMTRQVEKQFNIMVGIVVLFTLFSLITNVFSIMEKNKYNFGVELLCGAGIKDIYMENFGFIASVIAIGDIMAVLLLLAAECGIKSIIIIQMVALVFLIVMAAGSYLYIRKMKIGEIIGGKE